MPNNQPLTPIMEAETPHADAPPGLPYLVALLLLVHFVLTVTAALDKSNTFDELAHLTAGYSYWLFDDYRLQPENGNLPQRWAALPLLVSQPVFPSREQMEWRTSDIWHLGNQFLYPREKDAAGRKNNADSLILQGRAMIALLGVVIALFVFLYARKLFGWRGGLLSLILCTFCPSLLAHGGLITSDLAAALFFLGTLASTWWVLHEVTPWTVLISALVLAGLFLAKFSAVIIAPVLLLLVVLRLLDARPLVVGGFAKLESRLQAVRGRPAMAAIFLAVFLIHAIVTWAMIWTFFSFRYSPFENSPSAIRATEQYFPYGWNAILDAERMPPSMAIVVNWARDWRVLPEPYLYGFAFTVFYSQARLAFYSGEIGNQGWPTFFPFAFLVKTPLALFPILGLALLTLKIPRSRADWRGVWEGFYQTAPLWIFLVVFWAFAIRSHLNIGHRHILPTYPPLYILAGAAAWWWRDGILTYRPAIFCRLPLLAWCCLNLSLVWLAAETLWRWPHYLAYFNQVIGGPSQGYKHLVDSSLDWGQDLPGLKKWLDHQGIEQGRPDLYLSYFGSADPYFGYGIDAVKLPQQYDRPPQQSHVYRPGIYCISATNLQGAYLGMSGTWDLAMEGRYRKGMALHHHYNRRNQPDSQEYLAKIADEKQLAILNVYHALCFRRLCEHLRQREPDAQIGYSILIFMLSPDDLHKALATPVGP